MREMVLNAACVINRAWVGMGRANQVSVLHSRQSGNFGMGQSISNRIGSVAILKMT